MTFLLSLVFFASGAAALLFETLWFRQAGLILGNTVWATSLVTSSFMAGLAIGNAWAGQRGDRWTRPLRIYARLELAIGAAGIGLVLFLPGLSEFMAPLLTTVSEQPAILNAFRFGMAFVMLLVPASAMGATLPSLTLALAGPRRAFGRVLGVLYGANTLGAVTGALAGEMLLIERFGIRGTGLAALALNLLAAGAAWHLSARVDAPGTTNAPPSDVKPGFAMPRKPRLLVAAFLSGAILLALEVIWFRLLILLVYGTTRTFAVMLAVVLLGIALGGLLAGALIRSDEDARRWLPAMALFAGAATAWAYSPLADVLTFAKAGRFPNEFALLFAFGSSLMLPTSILSGVLFTLLGSAIKESHDSGASAAGALTLANTVGAALGSLASTFVLLPRFGMEKSLFLLALLYGVVALCVVPRSGSSAPRSFLLRAGSVSGVVAFILMLAFFPFGLMARRYAWSPIEQYVRNGETVVAHREGLTETVTYLVRSRWRRPVAYRLVTNSHSMSGSEYGSQRYMRHFVYLPVAMHARARTALQISYGVGMTAKAIAETKGLRSIDLVDISRDILELGRVVFPQPGALPLDDPRFRVHVEDGRFFLLTTGQTYDLITAEPPPPKAAGIASLYSREFFALAKSRLNPGGLVSYWFPVYQATPDETKSMMRAFCDVFEDCTLWTGWGLEWTMVGSNGFKGRIERDSFERQWKDEAVRAQLEALAFETPEMLGTTFLADAAQLKRIYGDALPLDDDHPLRISTRIMRDTGPFYQEMMNVDRARRAFESSDWVRAHWPEDLRESTLRAYAEQGFANLGDMLAFGQPHPSLADVEHVLVTSTRRAPILSLLRQNEPDLRAARDASASGEHAVQIATALATDALGDRDYSRAAERYGEAHRLGGRSSEFSAYWVLALSLAGRNEEARQVFDRFSPSDAFEEASDWAWLKQRVSRP